MKKYLAIFAVLFTVILSSCSNDDIPVTHVIAFKVDPSTVISSFEEFRAGDLTSLPSEVQLRIRLLVYNEDGMFVDSKEDFSEDYTHIKTFLFNLPEGEYTTVAITDVVGKNSSSIGEFYTLSNQEKLNTTTLTYTSDFIGGKFAILGLTTEKQHITTSTSDINIKVRPAGALIFYLIDDWNACLDYSYNGVKIDVEDFKLVANQFSSDLTLNTNGEPIYSSSSSSDFDYIWCLHTRNPESFGGYGYAFKFPMNNVKVEWLAVAQTGTHLWGEPAVVDIEAGKEYKFRLDVANDKAEWSEYGIDNLLYYQTGSVQKFYDKKYTKNTEFNFTIENEPVSIRAIDYLKKTK